MSAEAPTNFRLRLHRDSNAVIEWLRARWLHRWFRWGVYAVGGVVVGWLLIWLVFARDLPSVDQLRDYEPPLPTIVRDAGGMPVHTYARERRVQLDYSEYPQLLIRSFLAAEDKTFF